MRRAPRWLGRLRGLARRTAALLRLRVMPRTLFGRTLIIFITPLILVQVVSAYFFYDRYWTVIASRLAEGVATEIAMTAAMISRTEAGYLPVPPRSGEARPPPFARPVRTATASVLAMAERQFGLALSFRPAGKLPTRRQARGPLHNVISDAVSDRVGRAHHVDATGLAERVEVQVRLESGILRVLVPVDRVFDPSMYAFALWMMGSATLLLVIALIFLRNQIRPIRRLAIAAERFGRGQEVGRFQVRGALEVRQAARAFLVMRDRLQRQLQQRTEMLAGVSHDLRTPLTRMRLQVAMIDDERVKQDLTADLDEMHHMIEGYLAFARGEGDEAPQRVPVAELLSDVVAAHRRGADATAVELSLADSVAAATAFVRVRAVRRCLDNLVANGLRYGGRVVVQATLDRDLETEQPILAIAIDDDGPGIPAADREAVFRPFHRREASRNQATGGIGLGLTLARDVARSHGGDLVLRDSPLGGLRCALRLPL